MITVETVRCAPMQVLAKRRLVVVDSDDVLIGSLTRTLKTPDWEVVAVSDHRLPDASSQDSFIIDVCPGGRPRIDLLERVRRSAPSARVVAVTAYPSIRLAVAATKAGADDCLAKPVHASELLAAVRAQPLPAAGPRTAALPSLARVECDYIARVLDSVGGNISLAARTLGIQRSTLQRRIKKYPPRW